MLKNKTSKIDSPNVRYSMLDYGSSVLNKTWKDEILKQ